MALLFLLMVNVFWKGENAMKIPSNNVLKALCGMGIAIGASLTASSCYWLGRRDELNQVLSLGDEHGKSYTMFDSKKAPKELTIIVK